jgi:general secretion pathway protein L
MRALLLFAEDEVGAIEGWFRLDEGRVVARGARIDALPPSDEEERIYLLLGGSEVTIRWLELAALTDAQALAAARIEIADNSLGSVEALHLAIGPLHGSHRIVAAIAGERMAGWIDWATSLGLEPDHVVPLPLLIAYGEGPTRVWKRPGRTVVHGYQRAFAIEPELAAVLLGEEAVEAIDDIRFEAELPATLPALPLDLRQGAWSRRRTLRVDPDWRRRMDRLAIAAAILIALIPVARLGRIVWDGYRLRSEAASVAQKTLGLSDRPSDPRALLRARLERLQGPGMGLVDGAAVLFSSVRETPNVELGELRFDESGTLSANITTASAADLAGLVQRIGSSGLVVEISGSGRGTTSIRIHRP